MKFALANEKALHFQPKALQDGGLDQPRVLMFSILKRIFHLKITFDIGKDPKES